MAINQEDLLPIDEDIALSDAQIMRITKVISNKGATGIVYGGELRSASRAEQRIREKVAVKAYRPHTDPARPDREASLLEKMMEWESEEADRFGYGPGWMPTPRYYGRGNFGEKGGGTPFIVMEFIEAQELMNLANNKELSPAAAISAICQFCAFLEIIHGKDKVFKDFKSENLWWSRQSLRILDVGDIADIRGTEHYFGKPIYDLLKTSILLFKLLTGYGLRYSTNGLEERVEPLLNRFPLDWGIKRFFRRSLGRGINTRYSTARQMREALQILAIYWGQSKEELFRNAVNLIASKNSKGDRKTNQGDDAERARAMLGVIENKFPGPDERVVQAIGEAEKQLTMESHLEIGKQLLEGGYYTQALDQFEKDLNLNDTTTLSRRWTAVAKISADLPPTRGKPDPNYPKYALILDLMEDEKYPEAMTFMEDLPESIRLSNSYGALRDECDLWLNMNQADAFSGTRNYSAAEEKYRAAKSLLDNLPNSALVSEETGDLMADIANMQYLARTVGEADKMIREGKTQMERGEFDPALRTLESAVILAPEDPIIIKGLIWAVDYCLQNGRYMNAGKLADIGLTGPNPDLELMERRDLVQRFRQSAWMLQQSHVEDFVVSLKMIYGQYAGRPELFQVVRNSIGVLLNNAEATLTKGELPGHLRLLIDFVRVLEGENSPRELEILRKVNELAKIKYDVWGKLVDELEAEAIRLIHSGKPRSLEEARLRLRNAEQLAIVYTDKIDSVRRLSAQVDTLLSAEKSKAVVVSNERTQKLQRLLERQSQINSLLEKRDIKRAKQLSSEMENSLASEISLKITDFIAAAYSYLESEEPDNPNVIAMIDEASVNLDYIGPSAWRQTQQKAEERIAANTAELSQIGIDYHAGKLDEVAGKVDLHCNLNPNVPEWKEWSRRIYEARQFNEWRETDEKLVSGILDRSTLNSIRIYLGMDLPRAFWQSGHPLSYLNTHNIQLKDKVNQSIHSKRVASASFFEIVKDWIYVIGLLKRLPTEQDSNEKTV